MVLRQREDFVQAALGEQRVIALGVGLALAGPVVQMRQLDVEHGGLDRIEAAVQADDLVIVARLHAVRAQQFQLGGQIVAIGRQQSAVSHAAEIFGGIETEAADVAQRAGVAAGVFGADRLAGIFDDRQIVLGGDAADFVHRGALAEQMHRQDGFGALPDERFDFVGIEIERARLDIDEDRLGAQARDGAGGGEERVAGADDFVAAADFQGHQRQKQGIAAGGAGDGVARAGVLRNGSFQLFAIGTKNVAA